tara:strand:+ start:472 stop:840 length:369 start_codon:yes stop_codon:yes gene_type:complete
MATNATWTVVFDDKLIIKQTGSDAGTGYEINDDAFWSESKFSNIWAIQYQNSVTTDEVEYRDKTPNSTYADANLGDFQQFIDLWDAANLAQLQSNWDNDNIEGESEADKIARLGPRPTSYSS